MVEVSCERTTTATSKVYVFHHLWDDDRTIDINSDGFHNFDVNIAKY